MLSSAAFGFLVFVSKRGIRRSQAAEIDADRGAEKGPVLKYLTQELLLYAALVYRGEKRGQAAEINHSVARINRVGSFVMAPHGLPRSRRWEPDYFAHPLPL